MAAYLFFLVFVTLAFLLSFLQQSSEVERKWPGFSVTASKRKKASPTSTPLCEGMGQRKGISPSSASEVDACVR
jgi:hypothetical protein